MYTQYHRAAQYLPVETFVNSMAMESEGVVLRYPSHPTSTTYLQSQSALFGRLPPEIRIQIYGYTLIDSHLVQHIFRGKERARLRLRWGGSYLGDRPSVDEDGATRFRHEPCQMTYYPIAGCDKVAHQVEGIHWRSKPTCIFLTLLLTCRRMYGSYPVRPQLGTELECSLHPSTL